MPRTFASTSTNFDLAIPFVQAQAVVTELLQQFETQQIEMTAVRDARATIESLPIATEDYSVAINRLLNASRYALNGEFGAASFELRMLSAGLTNWRRLYA